MYLPIPYSLIETDTHSFITLASYSMNSFDSRRKKDEALRVNQQSVKSYQDLEAMIRFANQVPKSHSAASKASSDISPRRAKLRKLFQQEEEQYLEHIAANEETTAQRNQRLKDRAKELKDIREVERRAFAEKKLLEREFASSDESRALLAKLEEAENAAILRKQIDAKRAIEFSRLREERELEAVCDASYRSQLEREHREAEERAATNAVMKEALDAQVAEKASRIRRESSEFIEQVFIRGERESVPKRLPDRIPCPAPLRNDRITESNAPDDSALAATEIVKQEKTRLENEIAVQELRATRMREFIAEHRK